MCGRLNVIDDPFVQELCEILGIKLNIQTNLDLRPTDKLASIVESNGTLVQQDCTWGIKPNWSKSLLINAKSETVAEKATFKQAFKQQRCLVPCAGWYEWRDEGGKRKQKYLFTHKESRPFLMAGIWYLPRDEMTLPQLVTLTTDANDQCKEFHHRMPVLIDVADIDFWLNSSEQYLPALMQPSNQQHIDIRQAA
jgi:putative SOS response-associated peptidase YedK